MKAGDISRANVVKCFSATMVRDREVLGEKVTEWLAANPRLELLDVEVVQSSDSAFHCVTIVVWACDPSAAARVIGRPAAGGKR